MAGSSSLFLAALLVALISAEATNAQPPTIPTRLLKMGANYKPEFTKAESAAVSDEGLEGSEGSSDEEYSGLEETSGENNVVEGSSEEAPCPSDLFWHNRGKQCVPLICATNSRNPATGKCRPPPTYYHPYYGNFAYYPGRSGGRSWNNRNTARGFRSFGRGGKKG